MDLAALKSGRGVCKGSLTKAVSYLTTLDSATADVIALKNRRKIMEQNFDKFENFQQGIEEKVAADANEFSTQLKERDDFTERYIEAVSIIDQILEDRKPKPTSSRSSSSSSSSSFSHPPPPKQMKIKLPPIQIPTFSGKFDEWTSFKNLYDVTVHSNPDLSDVQKFQYLKSSLTGEAASVIQNLPITSSNYNGAWTLLHQRYNNDREIVFAQVRKLFNITSVVQPSSINLQSLVDQTNECVRALKELKQPTDKWDTLLVYMTVEKLDSEARKQWAVQLNNSNVPTLNELFAFLEKHIRGLNAFASSSPVVSSRPQHEKRTQANHSSNHSTTCVLCKTGHPLYKCTKFLQKSTVERSDIVKKFNLCYNCFREHRTVECTSKSTCRECNKKHNTLLHFARRDPTHPAGGAFSAQQSTPSHFSQNKETDVILSTAITKVQSRSGEFIHCRVLLDGGAGACFIKEETVKALGLKRMWDRTEISGIGGLAAGYSRGKVRITLHSCVYDESITVEALILKQVTNDLPSQPIQQQWDHLAGIKFADPNWHSPAAVDISLSNEFQVEILRDGKIVGEKNTPSAVNTLFGWAVAGRSAVQTNSKVSVNHAQCETEQIMRRFWEVESIPKIQHLTQEEKFCEEHFVKSHSRLANGRFCVQLPLNNKIENLGFSRDQAINRLKQVERRLTRYPQYREEYNKFMEEYIKLGHMQRVPRGEVTERQGKTYYLPHHFVLKPDSTTTKFRVVFDASAKTTTGLSINDCISVGSTLQEDILSLLCRFRLHKVVFKADIAKMFRQFLVTKEHSHLQRIVWRKSPNHPVEDYQLLTVTYGTASAPFLSTRCIQQLATDNMTSFPGAAAKLMEDLYVDDLMSGEDSEAEAIRVVKDLNQIAESAGLSFRKWSSNSSSLLEILPEDIRETKLPLSFNKDEHIKALGVQWNPLTDEFSFNKIDYPPVQRLTKRIVTSQLGKIYDPLGFISPVTIVAKMFLQELWKSKLDWDDPLSEDLRRKWNEYLESVNSIDEIRIPRWIKTEDYDTIQIHAFCDASELALGAVAYLRCLSNGVVTSCKKITSKSKVAPISQLSLPRLELCGAVLLTELVELITTSLRIQCDIFAWTDSMIVLQWLASHPGRWQTFVGNRVSIIQNLVPFERWNHVKSADNPADLVSRGMSASQLKNCKLWWNGPEFLLKQELPQKPNIQYKSAQQLEERKKKLVVYHTTLIEDVFEKFSSFSSLQRVFAYVLRFINIKIDKKVISGPLTVTELKHSLNSIVRVVQFKSFHSELEQMRKNQKLSNNSKLLSLNPFIDNNGVIRVGGRISKAKIPVNQKHPIILPCESHFTKLLINYVHLCNFHSGLKLTWCLLQSNYWIINAKNTIRFQIRKCVVCRRHRAETMSQLMGSLPVSRLTPGRAFQNCGVDYAGPINLRVMKGRSNKLFKGYFCIFICMASKAVHLEAVSDLTTDAFIATFRRFVARRGIPTAIHSDQGTNFVGADKELQRLLLSEEHNTALTHDLSRSSIEFKFNSSASPHFGGLWESGVKSVKFHLKRIIGSHTLTFEEFATILCQVEACLNSRPLCAMTTDPDDIEVLTPGHLIIGHPITALPDADVTHLKINKLSRWQFVQQVFQHW